MRFAKKSHIRAYAANICSGHSMLTLLEEGHRHRESLFQLVVYSEACWWGLPMRTLIPNMGP